MNLFLILNPWKRLFTHKSQPITRRPARTGLRVEALEDRLVPAVTDMTQLAQMFPAHDGPTHLWLNFDGGTVEGKTIQAFTGTNADRAEILERVAEIFVPFNVQVSRRSGAGDFDNGGGNTTIFVGGNAANTKTLSSGKTLKYTYSSTPGNYSDYPGSASGLDHQPNSDSYDLAFIDPVSQTAPGAPLVNDSDLTIAQSIAHEAGHTFGLAHVLSSPVNDVMSYNSTNQFFADKTFPITTLNNNGTTTAPDDSLQPRFTQTVGGVPLPTVDITTQNSYTFLQAVLGVRPGGSNIQSAHANSLDPYLRAVYIPQGDNIALNQIQFGTLSGDGVYNVFRRTAIANELWTVSVTGTSGSANPVLFVYDKDGNRVAFSQEVNAVAITFPAAVTLGVTSGQTYYVVVGSRDGVGTGGYQLKIKEGLFDIDSNGTLYVRMANLAQGGDGKPDTIDVTTNGNTLVVTVDGIRSQYDTIKVRSLQIEGSSDQDNITLHDPRVDVKVYGLGGPDTLTLDDANGVARVLDKASYTITDHSIEKKYFNSFGPLSLYNVTYSGISNIKLITASTTNTINVVSLPTNAAVTIQTTSTGPYAADNTINVSSAALVPGSQLSVQGGTVNDKLVIQDNNYSSNPSFAITRDSVSFGTPIDLGVFSVSGTVPFSGLKSLSLVGDSVGRVYNVLSWTPDTALSITGGSGKDFFNLGPQLDALSGDLIHPVHIRIDGGGGFDSLTLSDSSNNDHGAQYTVDATSVSHAGDIFVDLTVDYARVQSVGIIGGGQSDTVDVDATLPSVTLNINTGGGDDTVIVGTYGNVSNVKGPVLVDGGEGNNTLQVSDYFNSQIDGTSFNGVPLYGNGYTVTANHIQARQASVSYGRIQNVHLLTSAKSDYVTVTGTPADATVSVSIGLGIVPGSGDHVQVDMDGVQGPLAVYGSGAADTLTLINSNQSVGRTFEVTDSAVTRDGSATVTYRKIGSLAVRGTLKDDQFFVDSTAAGVATQLYGGQGNDWFGISYNDHNLDAIQGRLEIDNLGGGSNTLSVYDDWAPDAHDYSLTSLTFPFLPGLVLSNILNRSGSAPISIGLPKCSFDLHISEGSDTPTVQRLKSGTDLIIYDSNGDPIG
jgi:hypothetical protein